MLSPFAADSPRWCFWINLPFGGFAAAAVIFLLPARDPASDAQGRKHSTREGLKRLDYLGAGLMLVLITCLLLALQWGGNKYAWSNWRIILLFTLGGALVPVFGWWQVHLGKRALIPVELFKNRTEVGGSIAIFMLMLAMVCSCYD
jgi:MFS family permease